jgi:putative flippase GtrA
MTLSLKSQLIFAAIIGELYFFLLLSMMSNLYPSLFNLVFFNFLAIFFAVTFPVLTTLFLLFASYAEKFLSSLSQFARFFLVGVLNTLIDVSVLNVLVVFFVGVSPWYYSMFKAFSFFLAAINSYFWNKYWVFRKTGSPQPFVVAKEFLSFISVSIGGLVVNVAVFAGIFALLGAFIPAFSSTYASVVSALAASLASIVWNFTGYKFLVFKR